MYIGMNYFNGDFQAHRSDFRDINPSTEEELGLFPNSTKDEVGKAVEAAKNAFRKWKKISRVKRAEYFYKLAALVEQNTDKLIKIISEETGKSKNESYAEVMESLHMIQVVAGSGRQSYGEYYASEVSHKDAYVIRKPKGVVAVITPFNFPCAISLWNAAPAIIEGNCVVHKPSELTPMTAQFFAELYHKAEFPPGVYNLVHGDGETGKNLVESDVQCILFTGSYEVGQIIRKHCASTFNKTCSCETGSKSAVIVFPDGNLDLAIDVSIASAFKLSGQRCVSSGRLLLHKDIFNIFMDKFIYKAATLKIGGPFETPEPYFGPLISREAASRVIGYNEMVRSDKSSKIMLDYNSLSRAGYFLSPFVYTANWGNKRYLKEEVFGPHVALIPFSSTEEAINIYNDTDFGLAAGVITNNFKIMRQCRDEIDAGMIYLNGGSIAAESSLPFGGVKKSGNGYKSAAGTYRAVTDEVAVTVNHEDGITWAQGLK